MGLVETVENRSLWEDRLSPNFTFVGEMEAAGIVPIYEAVQVGETVEKTVENLADFFNFTWENEGGSWEDESHGKWKYFIDPHQR